MKKSIDNFFQKVITKKKKGVFDMSLTREQAMSRIEGQRRAISEHIEKFENYSYPQDKEFALRTIRICQDEIEKLKRQCNVSIESSWEDYWSAPYYALDKAELLLLREEIISILEQEKEYAISESLTNRKVKTK